MHDREAAKTALQESDSRFRRVLDEAPVAIWTTDALGQRTSCSLQWQKITGQGEADALGEGWLKTVHPEDRPQARKSLLDAIAARGAFHSEFRLRRADGSWAWVISSGQPRLGSDDTLLGFAGSVLDISERHSAEAALRESADHYRRIVELNLQFLFSTDPNGMLLEISPRWREMVGMTQEETIGTGWLRAVHPDDLPETRRVWEQAMQTGQNVDHEQRVRLADGTYRWFRGRASAQRNTEGCVVRWYGSLVDIHERKAADQALRESEAFAQSILECSDHCIQVLDLSGRPIYMNSAGYRMLGINPGIPVQEATWDRFLPAEYRDMVTTAFDQARAGHAAPILAHRLNSEGQPQWLEATVCAIPNAEGRPHRLLATWHDITTSTLAREMTEQARQEAETAAVRLSVALESTMDSVILIDHEWRLTHMNQNASQLLKQSEKALGRNLWDLFPDAIDGAFARHYRQALETRIPVAFDEFSPALQLWLEVQAYPTEEGLSIFFRDVTERRRAEQERQAAQEKMAHMAHHDALTGLPNRVFFQEQLALTLENLHTDTGAALLCLDLDGFKSVNDTLGHPAGDLLLQQVAERLRCSVRSKDTVVRLGGDEFAIVQDPARTREDVERLACRIVETLAKPFHLGAQQVVIGTSVGIALMPGDGTDADALMKMADIALYRAKREGRGTYRFY